jgi:hypothetical protein
MNRVRSESTYRAARAVSRRSASVVVAEIQNAEYQLSSRRHPMLLAMERAGKMELLYADAVIAADVLGNPLTFKRLHGPRSQRRSRPREPHGPYAIPRVVLPNAECLKELAALSGYTVCVLNGKPTLPEKAANVESVDSLRARAAKRRACA